jgi:predicted nuclease of predicted toxin-antitoxin system
MKFFIDRCAGRRLAAWLRDQGRDVAEAQERGPDPGDRELLATAAAEGRMLVTMDKDFGDVEMPSQVERAAVFMGPGFRRDDTELVEAACVA